MRYVLALLLGVVLCGCEVSVEMGKAPPFIAAVSGAVDSGEPVFTALEGVVGPLVPANVAEAGEGIAGNVATGAGVLSGIVGLVPGGQPYAEVIGGLGILASAIGVFLGKRLKATKAALKTMVKVADVVPGKAIKSQAVLDGTSAEVEKAYLAAKLPPAKVNDSTSNDPQGSGVTNLPHMIGE